MSEGHTFIQWKGTQVCMDVTCPCGADMHFDEEFLYAYLCPKCNKVYEFGTSVTITENPDYKGCIAVEKPQTYELTIDGVRQPDQPLSDLYDDPYCHQEWEIETR